MLKDRKKKITEQPKRWWKWALLKKLLNIWPIYSVSITSQTSITSKISNRQNYNLNYNLTKLYSEASKQNNVGHCSQEELSIFCATAHYLKDKKTCIQICFMSWWLNTWQKNNISHNSYIINDLKPQELSFDMAHYWSDGLFSQFKDQFNFTNFIFHEKVHGIPADWSFFATSHSKVENDGAGVAKNSVWTGPILESNSMHIFSEKGPKNVKKVGKRANYLKIWAKMN